MANQKGEAGEEAESKGARHGRGHLTQMPKEENEDNKVGGKNLTHNEMDNEKNT